MKKFFMKNGEGGELKLDVVKVIITTVVTLLLGAMFTWGRWVTIQSYEVATNKNNIVATAQRFENDLTSLKDLIEKNNRVLHMRATKIDDKYDTKLTENQKMLMQTNTLIVDMLIQKNKEIQLKKQEVEMQQQVQQQSKEKIIKYKHLSPFDNGR